MAPVPEPVVNVTINAEDLEDLKKDVEETENEDLIMDALKVTGTGELPKNSIYASAEILDKRITKPVNYDGFKVRAVSGVFGRYSYSEARSAYIDYENNDGDELSMTLEQWRGFLDELHRAALVLGVEL